MSSDNGKRDLACPGCCQGEPGRRGGGGESGRRWRSRGAHEFSQARRHNHVATFRHVAKGGGSMGTPLDNMRSERFSPICGRQVARNQYVRSQSVVVRVIPPFKESRSCWFVAGRYRVCEWP